MNIQTQKSIKAILSLFWIGRAKGFPFIIMLLANFAILDKVTPSLSKDLNNLVWMTNEGISSAVSIFTWALLPWLILQKAFLSLAKCYSGKCMGFYSRTGWLQTKETCSFNFQKYYCCFINLRTVLLYHANLFSSVTMYSTATTNILLIYVRNPC